ncbi:PREDICTED: uncharacterized protein LOC109114303 [Nelumbo nucifera]|uniref:Uncharacterized protein LOC109114303 n=1 Tax=Nelumbo nucifera TaxID=4432 RepID=A0A1U8Q074_NELNU|nr:PREDICTED: uncharacterized protein LOC109114303 [Nelumbo nucifera]
MVPSTLAACFREKTKVVLVPKLVLLMWNPPANLEDLFTSNIFRCSKRRGKVMDFWTEDFFRSRGTFANMASRRLIVTEFWSPPDVGWKKLNFDRSCLGNPGTSGIGGVMREENGNIIAMFSGPTQHGGVVNSELKATVFGVEKAKELGINRLVIEGDSKVVVNWLKEDVAIWRLRNEFRRFKQASKDMEIHYLSKKKKIGKFT